MERKAPPPQPFGTTVNRVADVMRHLDRYAFKGVGRLAEDARVSHSAISRLLHGEMNPSFAMVARITAALERQLGRRLDPRELVAESGGFPTRHVCELSGCRGCLPECARDEYGDVKAAFAGVRPGAWVCSAHPKGYVPRGGGR